MRAIGIDLGTTNSLAAVATKEVRVLPNRSGEQLTPSVVSFVKRRQTEEGELVVGRQAVANAVRAPEDTIFSIKRLMGAVYGEARVEEVRQHINYRLAEPPPPETADQGVKVLLGKETYSPVDISAMILKTLRIDAEQALGDSVTHAVITVPAYFEERQRDATKQAAEQAGLTVLKIIDEPTAAAMFFGAGKEEERHRILVYDLGGGTFDISIIQMTGGQYQVMEITGDRWLGGDDFDRTIIARMIDWVKEEYAYDPSQDKDFLGKAKGEAEKAKIALGNLQSADIFAPLSVKIPNQGPVDIVMTIKREEFEADIRPLVDQSIELVNRALQKQNLNPDDISEVLLVGGSTGVPLVRQSVVDVFGEKRVKRHVNPMECVALGAAILASQHEIKEDVVVSTSDSNLIEVTAMHLGIAAVKGENPDAFVPIIEKGTPYPLSEPKKRIFTPVEENQKLIRVAVYEGLSDLASLNDQQGIIEFPLPRGIGAANPVEISFNFDRNRVLTVGVRVLGTDLVKQETLRRNTGRVDKPKNLLDDWREDLQPSLRAGVQFLRVYGAFMDPTDRKELEELIKQGEQALDGNNQVEGRRATQALQNKIFGCGVASQLFIAERAMQEASPGDQKQIAQAVKQIRVAHAVNDHDTVEQWSQALRLQVAQLMARRPEEVADKARPRGGLRDSS